MNPTSDSVSRRPAGEATSPSLLVRAQGNQPGAWERLVDLYAPLVYHWCARCNLGAEDRADVFQEVFRAVAVHLAGFRRDRAGDTFRVMLINLASVVGLRLAGVLIMTGLFDADLADIWLLLSVEIMLRGIALAARFLHGGWQRIKV